MRKSEGTLAPPCRVFGVRLEEVAHTHTLSGHNVPALVKHVVEYIEEHGGLFLVNGDAERVDWLRQRYDSGEEVELEREVGVASAVSLLRLFLQKLPEPLIPVNVHKHCLHLYHDHSNKQDFCCNMKNLLQQLPHLNYSLLRFLVHFLSKMAAVQQDSWSVDALAAVFGPDIFHLWTEGEDISNQPSVCRVLADLLDNHEVLFDSEDDDVSTTNEYSSSEQITELDEDLPEDTHTSCAQQHTHTGGSPEDSELGDDDQTDSEESETPFSQDAEVCSDALEDNSGMELDTDNNINMARAELRPCGSFEQTGTFTSCDQNGKQLLPCQPNISHTPHLQLFADSQWEASHLPHLHLPHIDWSCLHLQKEGHDPVPSFQSWQSSDEGEAELSPLAGRLLPPPLLPEEELKEDSSPCSSRSHPPLLAPRFLDFGSQRFLQQDAPSRPPRPRRAWLGGREAGRGGEAASLQLSRKLQHLKKKIKQFDEQFEKERNYKPSHADKASNPKVLKWMTELTKLRRQIKDAKHRAESELGPHTRPRSNTLPKSFGSKLDHAFHDAPVEGKGQRPSREETLEMIQRRMKGKRQEDGWPDDIKKMTKDQLCSEKTVLQKNLLHYEGLHGRPVSREECLVVKPLYDRYRLVKQMLTRVSITPTAVSPSSKRRNQTLQPIIEGETAHFCEELKEEGGEGGGGGEGEKERSGGEEERERGGGGDPKEHIMNCDPAPASEQPMSEDQNLLDAQSNCPIREKNQGEGSGKLELRLSSTNASSMPELLEQLWKTRAEKKRLRKTIREFEEDFYQHNGRNVQKEERVALKDEYREYKKIKAKLRLLEVLISKQDSSKSI